VMPKSGPKAPKHTFRCTECGSMHPTWAGKCPDCGTWDALERVEVEQVPANVRLSTQAAGRPSVVEALPLSAIEAPEVARFSTGSGEFDRVLGGGLVAGSVSLLGGDPGIGKSTLLLQAAAGMARSSRRVLYASSEESAYQVRLRAERLVGGLEGLDNLLLLAETSLGRILEQARQHQPDVLVLDSIQLVHHGGVDAVPGTPSQIRHCGSELVHFAKATGTSIVTVGHVTKDGQLAGPRVLEHIVDVVLSFEGDRHHAHRVVRGVKNRFGTTMEVGLFEMTGEGLQPIEGGGALLDSTGMPRPGTVAAPVLFGSRCLLTEVQGLVVSGFLGSAKRKATGIDSNRLAMVIAVLEQHCGLQLADQDIFAAASGGLRATEPAADLPLALAIAGAQLRKSVPPDAVAIGELGLGGEIRAVPQSEKRLREAARLGAKKIFCGSDMPQFEGLRRESCSGIAEAVSKLEP
jgi:DNA repair protein RadA/Sms